MTNPVLDVQGKNDTQINSAIQAEVAAGRYPMAIKASSTDYKGVLYDFSGTTTPATVTARTYPNNFREPDISQDLSWGDKSPTGTGEIRTILGSSNTGDLLYTEWKNYLQGEYNSMVASVIAKRRILYRKI